MMMDFAFIIFAPASNRVLSFEDFLDKIIYLCIFFVYICAGFGTLIPVVNCSV